MGVNRRKAASGMVLTVIWLITAAAALILTVVYFERLQKLYDKVDRENVRVEASLGDASGTEASDGLGNGTGATVPGDADGRDATGTNGGSEGTGITLAGEGGNPGGKEYSSPEGAGQENGSAGDASQNDPLENGNSSVNASSAGENTKQNETAAGDTTDSGNQGTESSAETDRTDNRETAAGNETAVTDGQNNGETQGTRTPVANYDYSLGLDPEKPIIALSFDDGPSSFTDRIVAALQANHVEATFFMVGYNVSAFKDTVRLVYDAGMEIGNHTSNHKNLSKIKEKEIKSEVFDNEDLINSIVPVGRIIVRPPYGALNSTVKSIVNRPMFNWSVDSLDWKTRNADSIVAQIQQDAKDGYIILMHDLYETTAEAAERIIPWLIDQGYQVTTVSKMFKARGVETEDGELYRMAQPAELR